MEIVVGKTEDLEEEIGRKMREPFHLFLYNVVFSFVPL